jgi:hypothetical protein
MLNEGWKSIFQGHAARARIAARSATRLRRFQTLLMQSSPDANVVLMVAAVCALVAPQGPVCSSIRVLSHVRPFERQLVLSWLIITGQSAAMQGSYVETLL